ncbi:hypothetical protein GCM10027615_66660 [Plantactinospora veratri]
MALERRQQHRRDWRRLWLYCRCGHRWACPDSLKRIPLPFGPPLRPMTEAEYRAGMKAFSPKVTRSEPIGPPPPGSRWARHGRDPLWNSPAGPHRIGRTGAPTPARTNRGHYRERTSDAERAGRM